MTNLALNLVEARTVADIEAIHTLIVGKDVTGVGAFA